MRQAKFNFEINDGQDNKVVANKKRGRAADEAELPLSG